MKNLLGSNSTFSHKHQTIKQVSQVKTCLKIKYTATKKTKPYTQEMLSQKLAKYL